MHPDRYYNPEEFRPERFAEAILPGSDPLKGQSAATPPNKHYAFGVGRRSVSCNTTLFGNPD